MIESLWHHLPLIVLCLLLGGVIGAFLYAVITPYFNYKPVVAKRVDVLPRFEALGGLAELRSHLQFSNGTTSYSYGDLCTVHVEVTNESTHTFEMLTLGITLEAQATILYIEAQPPDRHHHIKTLTPLDFETPPAQIDISLHPFNPTDTYKFRLTILSTDVDSFSSKEITLSSPESVRFVSLPGTEEILKTAAKSISLPLGPFKLSFR